MEHAVILEGARTPIGKFLGSFAETPAVELGTIAATRGAASCRRAAEEIDHTIIGHARQAGNGPNTGRQVSIHAGVPEEVSAYNVNIACGSGMKAVQLGAQQIALGDSEVVLAGGMENMTRVPFLLDRMRTGYRMGNATVHDAMYRDGLLDPLCGLVMGETAENLVDRYDLSREEQDGFALGVPGEGGRGCGRPRGRDVPGGGEDPRGRGRSRSPRTSIRAPTPRLEGLAKLSPVFREGGSVTAGNAAGITDGAAAMILMSSLARPRGGTGAARADRGDELGGRPAGDHGHRTRAGHEEGPREDRPLPRRHRPDRDQRGVRGTGARVRA